MIGLYVVKLSCRLVHSHQEGNAAKTPPFSGEIPTFCGTLCISKHLNSESQFWQALLVAPVLLYCLDIAKLDGERPDPGKKFGMGSVFAL